MERLDLRSLPQRLIDATLPSHSSRTEFVENVAINSQSDLLFGHGRLGPTALAPQLSRDKLWADLVCGTHASKLLVSERRIIRIGFCGRDERRILFFGLLLKKSPRPHARFGAAPGTFLFILYSQ